MTHVHNDPAVFHEEMLSGFLMAYSRYVERVPGASGVMRRGGPVPGTVSVVIGGGSGHYPAFAGLVGQGLAHGAVIGDIFTSPSTEQVYRVGRALDAGSGVVFSFGNYAGDVMNFKLAEERLVSQGVDCRTVLVTDDVASAPPHQRDRRRGVAGDFAVFKMAGAAADRGADIDEVERLARRANALTRTFGVAFTGCTFPGQPEPLFTVEPGTMELGLGIHGEPGVETVPAKSAAELARSLVDPLLKERPEGLSRAAVVLNGLGSTKYEELFVLYSSVYPLLVAADVELVLPEVGEFVTSLDMAGCSLSITWLDAELEDLWLAPADSPAFRRGSIPAAAARPAAGVLDQSTLPSRGSGASAGEPSGEDAPELSDEARTASEVVRMALRAMNEVASAHQTEWGRLDAVAGDGDHGLGMARGTRAAAEAATESDGGPHGVLGAASLAFADEAGGASGALWGAFLNGIADALPDDRAPGASEVAAAMSAGADALQRLGKCAMGDKTMYDSLRPFADAFGDRVAAGEDLSVAWTAAAEIATERAVSTADLLPRLGRARPLGSRSLGTQDPGATSMAACLGAVASVLRSGDAECNSVRS